MARESSVLMASTWSRLCLQQVSDGVEDDGQLLGCQEGRDPRQGWNWISFQKEKEGLKHGFYSKLETEETSLTRIYVKLSEL